MLVLSYSLLSLITVLDEAGVNVCIKFFHLTLSMAKASKRKALSSVNNQLSQQNHFAVYKAESFFKEG